jgi:FixJ family two-component response regulator
MENAVGPAPVYVVDDDEAVRDSLQTLLQSEGIAAHGFATSVAALAAIEACRPACLVLDLHLPGVSGLDLLRMLGARGFDVPVVMISGRIDRGARTRALASGAAALLHKPLDHAELVGAIRGVVSAIGSIPNCPVAPAPS